MAAKAKRVKCRECGRLRPVKARRLSKAGRESIAAAARKRWRDYRRARKVAAK